MPSKHSKIRDRKHALARAAERYGLELSLEELGAMVHRIRLGDFQMITKGKRNTIKVMVATDAGAELPVVYSTKRGTILTILPDNAAEVLRWRAKITNGQLNETEK